MIKNFCFKMIALVAFCLSGIASAAPIQVVTSFSILADMVKQVGGNYVQVTSLIPAGADAHEFEPNAKQIAQLAKKDTRLFVVNGLGFDRWSDRLIRAAQYHGKVLVASYGVKPIVLSKEQVLAHQHHHHHEVANEDHDHDHVDHHEQEVQYDPHAWQSLENGMIYVNNIAKALAEVDPSHASAYEQKAEQYLNEIQQLNKQTKATIASWNVVKPVVVTDHEAFSYFAKDYKVTMLSPLGISTEAEPSAKILADLMDSLRKLPKPVVFCVEQGSSHQLLKQIAKEVDGKFAGELYADTLAHSGPASTYLGMFRTNLKVLTKAFKH